MSGLKPNSKDVAIVKTAAEGSLDNNMNKLMTNEAYKQISSKFPALIPIALGVDFIEKTGDKTAIGAMVIMASGSKLLIPIIFSDGKVDATTFLLDNETTSMVALTKNSVKAISRKSPLLGGTVSRDKNKFIDIGDIKKLFIPPRTFSPKIASNGILMKAVESSDLVKIALAKQLENDEFREVFSSIYGDDTTKYIYKSAILADISPDDISQTQIIDNMDELMSSDWLEKRAAMLEYSRYGVAISQKEGSPTKSLTKIASTLTELKDIMGSDNIETFSGDVGTYIGYRKGDLKPIHMVCSRDISSGETRVISDYQLEYSIPTQLSSSIVSSTNGSPILKDFDFKNKASDIVFIVFVDGNNILGHMQWSLFCNEGAIKALGKTIIPFPGGKINSVVVESGSDSKLSIIGKTAYVGDKNVKMVVKRSDAKGRVVLIDDVDVVSSIDSDKLVRVIKSNSDYIYKQASMSKKDLASTLSDEGYDKQSIYSLIKEADANGSVELMQVNAKMDMLSNMIMNLAGKVESVTSVLAQQPEPQQPVGLEGMPIPAGQAEEMPQSTEMVMPENPQQPQQMTQQQPEEAQYQEAERAEADAQQQQQQQMMEQQQQPQQGMPQNQPDIGGMNAAIDPDVLRTLSEYRDSGVMDIGILSELTSGTNVSEVIQEHAAEIQMGVDALGRILMNMMVEKEQMTKNIGEKKYKTVSSNIKNIFVKLTDLYIDIIRIGNESSRQMED